MICSKLCHKKINKIFHPTVSAQNIWLIRNKISFLRHIKLSRMQFSKIFLFWVILGIFHEVSGQGSWVIVIHGGAGVMREESMNVQRQQEYRKILSQALSVGAEMAANGARAVDIVPGVIRIMEDSPLFNAGKGGVFTYDGKVELDASIMEGEKMNAGAVTGVTRVKNPILAAREVMLHSPHVFLSGKGASEFAQKQKLEMVKNAYFHPKEKRN